MKYKWILFDADNTLFDFHGSSEIAFHLAFKEKGIKSTEKYYNLFKTINLETWRAFDENKISHEEIKEYRFKKLFESFEIVDIDPLEFNTLYFKKLVENIRYMPGARELLACLYKNTKLALITNGMKEVQRPRLKSSEIGELFDLVVVSGEIGHSKPNHAFFQYVYERLDTKDKDKVLVVGDNLLADIMGANDFGFKSAWYNPYKIPNENGIVPDFELNNLNELIAIAEIDCKENN